MYFFFDTETGGLRPEHSLLTLSGIIADKDFNIVPVEPGSSGLYLKIKHEQYALTAGALSVNKIDLNEHHSSAMTVRDAQYVLRQFLNRARDVTGKRRLIPAGHNVAFDAQFLKAYLLTEAEWEDFFTYPAFDTAAIARFFNAVGFVQGGFSLTSLRDRFVPDASGQMHNAEIDNLTTIALARKFVSMVHRP
jgi:DNA polymerase III alpha subunit (gram-positive type)